MREKRHSFTLIEIVVACSLIALSAGALVFGIHRSVRSVQLQTSKERLERLFLQAFRFSTVSGHVGDVVIKKEGNRWEGYLNLWEIDAKNLCLLAQKCESIGQLAGVHSISLNDCDVYGATFRFFGGHGLCAVTATDRFERDLSPSEFRFFRDDPSCQEPELCVSLRPTPDSTPSEAISLNSYLSSVPHHPPFPNELLQST